MHSKRKSEEENDRCVKAEKGGSSSFIKIPDKVVLNALFSKQREENSICPFSSIGNQHFSNSNVKERPSTIRSIYKNRWRDRAYNWPIKQTQRITESRQCGLVCINSVRELHERCKIIRPNAREALTGTFVAPLFDFIFYSLLESIFPCFLQLKHPSDGNAHPKPIDLHPPFLNQLIYKLCVV